MQTINAYIHVNYPESDTWQLVSSLEFTSADSNWMLQGNIPSENDLVPWQEIPLPNGEVLHFGAVFTDPTASLSLYVRCNSIPIIEVHTKGYPCIRFVSPLGCNVSLQIHEND